MFHYWQIRSYRLPLNSIIIMVIAITYAQHYHQVTCRPTWTSNDSITIHLWTNKTIPFVIHTSLDRHRSVIEESINQFLQCTCVNFVPRSTEDVYIELREASYSDSLVGMQVNNTKQLVNLNLASNVSRQHHRRTVAHELAHVVGLMHEHQRKSMQMDMTQQSCSNTYNSQLWSMLLYYMNNKSKFNITKDNVEQHFGPFDQRSITLYVECLVARPSIQMHNKLSLHDLNKINYLYQCDEWKRLPSGCP